ncbi:chemosensory pili system protein ChpA (sensor histidine kinase/response regulator) [Natronocella acetinitrilica]|uniref:Chemotaxis protein CheA n=1 Tax=Natronocella acetinitrilica TaxID=414046 RepID=A0AAE3KGD3_9GAMM|nr:Hpt domain-containing protein [Natronocella acetinitrilica]MCP1675127.1 chemosensory pili system protein ChpA (sensor histidine kinase/response regulator) [Natronocella acetinitrilica]
MTTSDFDRSTLSWVRRELENTLKEAAQALEAYSEDRSDETQLRFCGTYLHQVYGTLQMLELYGVSMLAEELERSIEALLAGDVGQPEDAEETIMTGILRCARLLEEIEQGQQDSPLVVLGLINDLRSSRAAETLDESLFFSPDLAAVQDAEARLREAGEPIVALARRYRGVYQRALLMYFKRQQEDRSLEKIAEVLDNLDAASPDDGAAGLWWIAAGVVDGLRHGGLESTRSVKTLLGQVDRQLKRVIDEGETALVEDVPEELLKSLLYHVAMAPEPTERLLAIRRQFGLDEPADPDRPAAGPGADILESVAGALREDVTGVKDALDLHVRGGQADPERLRLAAESLGRVADTLGMLGMGEARTVVRDQLPGFQRLAAGEDVGDQSLMELARTLLYVESSLDNVLEDGFVRPEGADAAVGIDDGRLFDLEYRTVYQTAIREAIADIGAIKEAIVQFIERDNQQPLDSLEAVMRRLQGALEMIDLERAACLISVMNDYLRQEVLDSRAVPGSEALDALADTITSLEYYLEAVLERRSGREAILDVAQGSLDLLGYRPSTGATPERVGTELPPTVALEPEALDTDEPDADHSGEDHGDQEQPEAQVVESEPELVDSASDAPMEEPMEAPESPSVADVPPIRRPGHASAVNLDVPVRGEELDDEILEIFLEEVDEVLETIGENMPAWLADPEQKEPVTTLRRMWHTLKGSGRLAGALLLGELAWSVERLLNRVIEGNVLPTREVTGLVEKATNRIPSLAAELRGEDIDLDSLDIRGLMAQLQGAADGEPVVTAPAVPATSDEVQEAPAESAVDEVFADAEDSGEESDATSEADHDHDDATLASSDPFAEDPFSEVEFLVPDAEPVGEDSSADQEPGHDQALDSPEEQAPLVSDQELADLESMDGVEDFAAADDDADVDTPDPEVFEELEGALPANESSEQPELPDDFGFPDDDVAEPAAEAVEPVHVAAPVASGPTPLIDPALYEIFRAETLDHLTAVAGFIEGCRAQSATCQVTESLTRALHTLAGSARMANVVPVATLARSLEQFAGLRQDQGRRLDQADNELLEAGAQRIRELLDALGDSSLDMPGIDDVLSWIDERRQVEPPQTTEPAAPSAVSAPAFVDEPVDAVDEDLVALFLEEAEDILQFLEGTIARWEHDADPSAALAELHRSLHTLKGGARLAGFNGFATLCHGLESLVVDVELARIPADDACFDLLTECLDGLNRMVLAARTGKMTESPVALLERMEQVRREAAGESADSLSDWPQADEAGGDVELVEVFLEESAEVLQVIEGALQQWADDPDDENLLRDIQRALHTLKGGARMAGFSPMADLAHAVETLLNGVRDGEVGADRPLFDLLEQCHDHLYAMRENAAQGAVLQAPAALLQTIEARRGDATDADVEAPVEVPPPPAVAPPPQAPAQDAGAERTAAADMVRVRADLLDNLVNNAGEVSIYRARLDQQVGGFRFNLAELDQTVSRLREQLRTLEIETEAQILYRFDRQPESTQDADDDSFDPLELDRFSRMQELSRALVESVNDLSSIEGMLDNLAREAETLLLQQSRVNTELQDGLMRTRMVPFANLAPRLRRIVRQTAQELGRDVQLRVQGGQGEMDRNVLERVTAPLEHMLRNAVAHGIETPDARQAAGKPGSGQITVALDREGSDVVLRVSDDGSGMNLEAIRRKAISRGLMREDAELTDREIVQFVLEQGFSTAETVTQISGRGVGMDVVNAEIKQLGGNLEIDSRPGLGTTFIVRLPFTLAMNQALLCMAAEQAYAIPLTAIDGVVRLTRDQLETYFRRGDQARYHYAGQDYQVRSLAELLGTGEAGVSGTDRRTPVVLVQTGDHRLAIQVDALIGAREIVVKSVGPQISGVPGIFGATILADGRVVFILDVGAFVRLGSAAVADGVQVTSEPAPLLDEMATVMVVDDSITMRKVATRLLERNGMQVVTAKDGVDAVALLQDYVPHAMLLDIEMPRMDGYELATHMRNDERLREVPIIMITSRTGDKHRQRALDIGVDRYLGKPYQESELMDNLRELLQDRHGIR